MKIIKLTAENVKRLKAIEITPEGNLVVIGGLNDQGKTSTLSNGSVMGGFEIDRTGTEGCTDPGKGSQQVDPV